jgi:endonuclease YncB( thermonuclease family)
MLLGNGWQKTFICYFVTVFGLALSISPARSACSGQNGGTSVVSEIYEGKTLVLGDGRTIRLTNVLLPRRNRYAGLTGELKKMEKKIAELLLNKKVTLKLDNNKRDRYGRLFAHVTVVNDKSRIWIQKYLVREGLARVFAAGEAQGCVRELLTYENQARKTETGLWKTGHFAVRPASEKLLLGMAYRYEIVEGVVRNVADVRGRVYLNFGENWRYDFTVIVPKKAIRRMDRSKHEKGAAKLALAALKGKTIRVRGWIKKINGPAITIYSPEQIEPYPIQRTSNHVKNSHESK